MYVSGHVDLMTISIVNYSSKPSSTTMSPSHQVPIQVLAEVLNPNLHLLLPSLLLLPNQDLVNLLTLHQDSSLPPLLPLLLQRLSFLIQKLSFLQ